MNMRLILVGLLLPLQAFGQGSTPATGAIANNPAMNLVSNGGFEQFTKRDNLWDGVAPGGFLAGDRFSVPAITESGGVGDVAMPVSVAAGDMNNDNLTDIVAADPTGWFRVFFNSGTPTEPKFTTCEIVPIFLSRVGWLTNDSWKMRRAPRIALVDWSRRNVLDLLVGFYSGEVALLPNQGSATNPIFPHPGSKPTDIDRFLLPTSSDGRRWGNLFAPAAHDWNKDGKWDLLLGEGSYSANAVHLLLNQGSTNASPKFSEQQRSYLCYGDGREHLSPALVDYNNDKVMDVLVADRLGSVAVHLGKPSWKPGDEFEKASLISFGSITNLGGVVTVSTADFNGDGKFDLLIGRNSGRIGLALNIGELGQPKFGPVTDLKGTDVWATNAAPIGWSNDFGILKGNPLGQISSVDATDDPEAAPPEGKRALKITYLTPLNKVIKMSPLITGTGSEFRADGLFRFFRDPHDSGWFGYGGNTSTFTLQKSIGKQPVPGRTYQLSFKVRGQNFAGRFAVAAAGHGALSEAQVQRRGDRGAAAVIRNEVSDQVNEEGTISPSTSWTAVTKTISVKFKERTLMDPANWKGVGKPSYAFTLVFTFNLRQYDGTVYIDDVQLVEKAL
jgi:hypothetical protein